MRAVLLLALCGVGLTLFVLAMPEIRTERSIPPLVPAVPAEGGINAYLQVDSDLWFVKRGSLFTPSELESVRAAYNNCRTGRTITTTEFADPVLTIGMCVNMAV